MLERKNVFRKLAILRDKKIIFALISIIIGIAGLWVILSKFSFVDAIKTFKHARPFDVFMYLIMEIMIMLFFSLRWKIILKSMKLKVSIFNLFKYRIVGYGISYITPFAKVGGEPVRASLLKKNQIPTKIGLASVIIDKVIELSTTIILFFIAIIFIIIKFKVPKNTEIVLLLGILVFAFLVFLFYRQMMLGRNVILKLFKKLGLNKVKFIAKHETKIWEMEQVLLDYYQRHRVNFVSCIILTMFCWIFTFGELHYAMKIIGVGSVPLVNLFAILTFLGFAVLIPIPMALGSMEALQLSAFAIIGLASPGAIAFSMMTRVKDLMWTFIGIGILSYYGLKFTKIFPKNITSVEQEFDYVTLKNIGRIKIKKRGIPRFKIMKPRDKV